MDLKQPTQPTQPDLDSLLAIFYEHPGQLASFEPASPADLPPVYRRLLDHDQHMTVTVEEYYQQPVDVEVIQSDRDASHYSRKILLRRQSDAAVVQFGIVRLAPQTLEPSVFKQIESASTPLGRVLIEHNVMRLVQLHRLYTITCGPDLAGWLNVTPGSSTFGRTALIYCDGEPAVELLEIVAPVSPT